MLKILSVQKKFVSLYHEKKDKNIHKQLKNNIL